jgi:hypothetical protein
MTTNGDPVDILIYATCKQPEEVWKKSLLLNEVSDWLSGTSWGGIAFANNLADTLVSKATISAIRPPYYQDSFKVNLHVLV